MSDTTPGQAAGPVFHWPLRVYWEDTDAGGVVFYANYLKYFERGRTEWLRSKGFEQQNLREKLGGMFIVTDAQLHYRRPARLDDQLLVTSRLQEAARACITIGQEVLHGPHATGEVLCEGSVRVGWVSSDGLRPRRIPPSILEALS